MGYIDAKKIVKQLWKVGKIVEYQGGGSKWKDLGKIDSKCNNIANSNIVIVASTAHVNEDEDDRESCSIM